MLYVLAGSTMNAVAVAGSSSLTLSPTASTAFPAANLCDGRANVPTLWSAASTESTATVYFSGSVPEIDFCSVHGHNFSAVVPYLESSTDGSSWTTRATMTRRVGSFYSVLDAGVSAPYWRLRLEGAPTEALYLGEWVLGKATALATRPQYGGELELLETQARIPGPTGAQWIYARGVGALRRLRLEFAYDTKSAYDEAHGFFRACRGGYYPCVVALSDMDADLVIFGRITETISFTREHYTLRTGSWEILEDALPAADWTAGLGLRPEATININVVVTYEMTGGGVVAGGAAGIPQDYPFSVVAAGVILGGAASAAYQETLLLGLVHYWNFDETSGTRYDRVGDCDLTDNASVGFTTGKVGNAARFTNTSTQYLSAESYSPLAALDSLTLAFWVYLDFPPAGAQQLVGQNFMGAGDDCFWIYEDGVGGGVYLDVFDTTNSGYETEKLDCSYSTWHLVGWQYDAGTRKSRLFVDDTFTDWTDALDYDLNVGSAAPFSFSSANGTEGMKGDVDEAGVWGKVLTDGQIISLYETFSVPWYYTANGGIVVGGSATAEYQSGLLTNLVACWKLDETSGTRYDSVGDNDLTDALSNVTSDTGVDGNAAQFNGSSSYLYIDDNASLSLSSDTAFTVGAWVRLPDAGLGSGIKMVICKWGTAVDVDIEYSVRVVKGIAGNPDYVRFDVGNSVTSTYAYTTGTLLTNGAWHLLLCWHDPDTNTLKIQVNNGSIFSANWSGGTFDGSGMLALGRAGSNSGSYSNLRQDETWIWKGRVLSSDDRTFLYNSGSGRFHPFSS